MLWGNSKESLLGILAELSVFTQGQLLLWPSWWPLGSGYFFFSFQKVMWLSEWNLGIRWCWVTCVHHGGGLWGVVVLWCYLVSAEPLLSCPTGTVFLGTFVWMSNEGQNV